MVLIVTNLVAADRCATDPTWFRKVLGRYPTGVCVVTAVEPDGQPVGMTVGTFTSISLDPPLVGFFPSRSSRSWSRIQRAGKFCINILAVGQGDVCERFASRTEDKFRGLAYGLTAEGSPFFDGVVAWVDCTLYSVHEAGDHFVVLGEVKALQDGPGERPLVFCEGKYTEIVPSR
jgi:flavin reductase (DIM6/NTAB) family NADH-FMN oxidoreductase RutF